MLQQIRTDIQGLDQQLLPDFPAYIQLTHTVPLTLAEVRARLKADEALLLWVLSERAPVSWLLVIRPVTVPRTAYPEHQRGCLQTALQAPGQRCALRTV
ncbi:MAG: hypothetical protein R3E89_18580 [Thiolinea sp.]